MENYNSIDDNVVGNFALPLFVEGQYNLFETIYLENSLQVEFYANGWYRTRYFKKDDLDQVSFIFYKMSLILEADVFEYFTRKYSKLYNKWSLPCMVRGVYSLEIGSLNTRLKCHALPFAVNFELQKILEQINGSQAHKNLAMAIIRCQVAYSLKAVPGD